MPTTTSKKATDLPIKKQADTKILIKGARVHNLKNVDLELPKNQFIVFTGVSGSGKSSLSIDTLYAEGQRRYVESLTSYARQFLSRMDKPDVDYIKGLCPAIAIEQKVSTRTTRSTVGSLTEIYDYLRLLYARVGKTYSPISGQLVTKHEVVDVVDHIFSLADGTKAFIYYDAPVKTKLNEELKLLLQKGFTRVKWQNEVSKIEDLIDKPEIAKAKDKAVRVLVDRIIVKQEEELKSRVADSVLTAFNEGGNECYVETQSPDNAGHVQTPKENLNEVSPSPLERVRVRSAVKAPFGGLGAELTFNNKFEADGMSFELPSQNLFNFNNPYGACKNCEGFGSVIGIDEDLIIPDKTLSLYEGAIAPWRGEKMSEWLEPILKKGIYFDFPIHRAYKDLTAEEKKLLWTGNEYFQGLTYFFQYLEEKSYKIQYRVMLSRYRGKTTCPECHGSRIRKDAQYVKIADKDISELLMMPIKDLYAFFKEIKLGTEDKKVADRILLEVNSRLQTMMDVGLGYLTLNRLSNTLSGGETQRINLTRSIGSNLTSSMYILDEPSIGLHQRDTARLIDVLKNLRDLGNTVIVVEHDEDIMKACDHIVDMGPEAGINGGEVVYNGPAKDITKDNKSLTGKYLKGDLKIDYDRIRRRTANSISIIGATQHNLKDVDAKFPLNSLVVVTGVSGSGKTTLIKKILYPALMRQFDGGGEKPGSYRELRGDMKKITGVEMIDQNPLGRSSRSNPVTYVKAYDAIRELFAKQQLSKIRGYTAGTFSFNIEGGRCENCKGEGEVVVEMQFLADVHLKCEVCNGRKFKEDVLEVMYKDKNVYDVLELSIDEAMVFFAEQNDIIARIAPLRNVGLGYVKLGQSSSTLSGGEAQRVKLASFLTKGATTQPLLFIFDEPTTGLHFHDINKLMSSFQQLIEVGHSVVVIEHNMDVIKCADWVVDLGPDGGDEGGHLVYQGTPEGLVQVKESHTGYYLREKLEEDNQN
ncbi:MAG: excinuclease ABC subunit UvrA [Bacteroidetes bacterium]|nr:excinuclease ABC subunit UvrA [Bacteroidota bacterium]